MSAVEAESASSGRRGKLLVIGTLSMALALALLSAFARPWVQNESATRSVERVLGQLEAERLLWKGPAPADFDPKRPSAAMKRVQEGLAGAASWSALGQVLTSLTEVVTETSEARKWWQSQLIAALAKAGAAKALGEPKDAERTVLQAALETLEDRRSWSLCLSGELARCMARLDAIGRGEGLGAADRIRVGVPDARAWLVRLFSMTARATRLPYPLAARLFEESYRFRSMAKPRLEYVREMSPKGAALFVREYEARTAAHLVRALIAETSSPEALDPVSGKPFVIHAFTDGRRLLYGCGLLRPRVGGRAPALGTYETKDGALALGGYGVILPAP